jgi:hypothetical protein
MRQRGAPPAAKNGVQLSQRRPAWREGDANSWESASEASDNREHLPEAPRSHSEDSSAHAPWETTANEGQPQRRRSENKGEFVAISIASSSPYNYPQPQPQQHHQQYQNGASASVESLSNDRGGSSNSARSSRMEKARLEDFHTMFRTPHHAPDNKYQAFLLGQTARRKGPGPMVNKVCCAQGCAGFSAVGAVFLFFIGFLLDTQPLFIKGSLPKMVVQTDDGSRPVVQYILPSGDERLPSARTAYQAGFMYLITIVICLYTLYPNWLQTQLYRRLQQYQDIPDHMSDSDSTLPTFHTVEDLEQGSPTRAYQTNIFSRSFSGCKQWLAVRGWHPGQFRRRRQKHDQKRG